ncbi:hypothetical protein R1flu_000058 [Riccia fluitans]|uniref:Myb-like domain-containing protein n=1 Tax=Riccia fluitans TaxID=41844 RepID=A0ABD1XZC5_9MARC
MESPLLKKGNHQKPRIGRLYQADVPSCRSSARARSQEFDTRDHLFAYGLPVPITCIAFDSQSASRKRKLSADQSSSYASTVNSRCPDTLETPIAADIDLSRLTDNVSKDSISCASSSKDELVTLERNCLSAETGRHGAGEEEEHAAPSLATRRKKRGGTKRSCWLPKRRVTKKPRLEIAPVLSVEEPAEAPVDFNFFPKFIPGMRMDSWSPAEAAYFRLAIFLLGKRFCEIAKFIGTKAVVDVSDYFYSKFVRSPAWGRWKAAKSLRCKTAVRCEQIVEGWRQVELLRRLKLVTSDDAYVEIVKATSDFSVQLPEPQPGVEGKLEEYQRRKKERLETYVFKLKELVGLELLYQSIGMGGPRDGDMAKRDLTSGQYSSQCSLPPRNLKEKQTRGGGKTHGLLGSLNALPLRSEDSLQSAVSVGENYLWRRCRTPEEIAKDFWERVWPALEKKGWKTVNRKPTIRSTPKLKFLRPGVDKLHREERGISYFDDLKSVIEAVKDDPHLRHLAEPLLEDPVDDKGDASDALVTEEESKGGWSDDEDMFTTLDGKRTIVPAVVPSTGARGPDDSAESSSLDIDLNRVPSDVNSRPQEEPGLKNETLVGEENKDSCEKKSGFPLAGIDLNLLPPDEECTVDAGAATDNFAGLQREFFNSSIVKGIEEIEPISAILDVSSPERELVPLSGDIMDHVQQAPCPSPRLLDFISDSSLQAGSSTSQVGSPGEGSGVAALTGPVRPVISEYNEVPSRKRSLSNQNDKSRAEWVDNGRELVFLPKKRAISLDWISRGLGNLPGNTFFIRMNKAAVVQFSPNVSYCMPSMPASWWQSTRSIDMKFPVQGLGRAIQHCASNLLSSTCRRQKELEALLEACEGSARGSRANSNRSVIVPGFQEHRFAVVEAWATSEKVSSRGGCKRSCISEIEEDEGDEEEEDGPVLTQDSTTRTVTDTFVEDSQGLVLQAKNYSLENQFPVIGSEQLGWNAEKAKPISNNEQDGFLVPEKEEHEIALASQQQTQGKSIKFRIRGIGQGSPVVSKERSKRVPRNYSSRSGAWLRSVSKVWVGRDSDDFPSFSGSLNSCITSNGFRALFRDEEDASLTVKSEENDVSLSQSSSWGADDQDEEILSDDQDEQKPAPGAEWKASCKRMFSASAAAELFYCSSSRSRRWRLGTRVSRRRSFDSVNFSLDSEKKCDLGEPDRNGVFAEPGSDSEKKLDLGEPDRNDVFAEPPDKRIKVSHEDPVLRSSSVLENMYSDGNQVLPDREKDDSGGGCFSLKSKNRRSKPRHQIRNVSCERFLAMLYTDILEEELPVQNCSSEGPFQSPSNHLPHLRGEKPNKVRRRRPSLPCKSQQLVVQQSAQLKVLASAGPKRWRQKQVCAAVVMTRPEEDGRFTLGRTLSDLSVKSKLGRQCRKRTSTDLPAEIGRQVKRRMAPDLSANCLRQLRKRTVSGAQFRRRGESRWPHRRCGC